MNNHPFVSVIVAFYNIQQCVKYCLSSLADQDYQNCEILLIDDGSTDETGVLLDELKALDKRFKVLHKENGGLSDARNYGVKHSKGEFVTFVDGDDIVSPYYVSALVDGLDKENGIDLVIGTSLRVQNKKIAKVHFKRPKGALTLTHDDLCLRLMYEELYPSAWAHLAPKSVYKTVEFPRGRYYEEISTITQFIDMANGVALIDEPIYGYVVRKNSIVHNFHASNKQIDDYEDAITVFEKYMISKGYENSEALVFFRCLHLSRIYRLLASSQKGARNKRMKQIVQCEKDALKLILHDSRIGRGNKARVLILARLPIMYPFFFSAFDALRG